MHSPYIITQRADQCYSDSDGLSVESFQRYLVERKIWSSTAMCVKKETDLEISFYTQYIPGRLSQDVKSIHPGQKEIMRIFPCQISVVELPFRGWSSEVTRVHTLLLRLAPSNPYTDTPQPFLIMESGIGKTIPLLWHLARSISSMWQENTSVVSEQLIQVEGTSSCSMWGRAYQNNQRRIDCCKLVKYMQVNIKPICLYEQIHPKNQWCKACPTTLPLKNFWTWCLFSRTMVGF